MYIHIQSVTTRALYKRLCRRGKGDITCGRVEKQSGLTHKPLIYLPSNWNVLFQEKGKFSKSRYIPPCNADNFPHIIM